MSQFKRATLSQLQNNVGTIIYAKNSKTNPNDPTQYIPYTLIDIHPSEDGHHIEIMVHDPDNPDESDTQIFILQNDPLTGTLHQIDIEQDGKESIFHYYIKTRRGGSRRRRRRNRKNRTRRQ
jgi:hypothetical protein